MCLKNMGAEDFESWGRRVYEGNGTSKFGKATFRRIIKEACWLYNKGLERRKNDIVFISLFFLLSDDVAFQLVVFLCLFCFCFFFLIRMPGQWRVETLVTKILLSIFLTRSLSALYVSLWNMLVLTASSFWTSMSS